MSTANSGNRRAARLAVAVMAAAALGACTEDGGLGLLQPKDGAGSGAVARAETKPTKLIERDVEAPEVFNALEAGLWDGRPSLGGVWVAHPDVKDPERVLIRNSANGKDVIGALFRRERDIPGPRLQASSDAAVALGMLAGAPVKLEVVALRREEIAPEPETIAEAPAEAAAVPEAETVAEAQLEPVAEDAISASAPGATEAEPEPPAKKRFSLFKRKDKPAVAALAAPEEMDVVPIDAATASAAAAPDDGQADAIAAAVAQAAPETTDRLRKRWFGAGLFARKQTEEDVGPPLSALAPDEVRTASADITASPLPKPAARKSPLAKPYIQIGIFSVEANANTTAVQMRSNGVVPTVFEQTSGGKIFWRVVVGPARSSSERSDLLKKIKGIGFSDAYAVTN